jgi:hypothetical protein
MIPNLVIGSLSTPGSSGFNPLTLPDIKAWFDASDTATITVSSTKVTQWTNKVGNGKDLVQATGAYRPISGTRTVNSLNAIDYDSNVKTLANSDAAFWEFMSDSRKASAFIVFKLDNTPSGDPYWTLTTRGGSLGAGPGYVCTTTTANKWNNAINNISANIVSNISTSTVGTSTVCFTTLSDPGNATAANRSDIRKSTGAAEKNNTLTGTPSTDNPFQGLRVGDYQDGGTFGIDGLICEIIICEDILSADNILATQDYLISKWGV